MSAVKILGSELSKITINQVKMFFETEQEETAIVEFKSGDVSLEGIFKEVAAFLNTEGGLLIIGAPKEKKTKVVNGQTRNYCVGELTYSTNIKGKDYLFQKISSNIVPVPIGIKIEEFLTEKGGVFLIDVPQSNNPPHQVSGEGKYYLRMDRNVVPAPHGLVQALFFKRQSPSLIISPRFGEQSDDTNIVAVRVHNESRVPGERVSLMVEVFNAAKVSCYGRDFDLGHDSNFGGNFRYVYNFDIVLARFIDVDATLTVRHFIRPYLLKFTVWCRDSDSKILLYLYDPQKRSFEFLNMEDATEENLIEIGKKIGKKITFLSRNHSG